MAIATFLSKPSSSTNALFRDWGSKLSTAIQSVGFVKTADTGQIDWLTVTKASSSNAMAGYEIFRFNDTLQSTTPIFLRLEYGGSDYVYFRTTVGKGTDGAGNITNVLHSALTCSNGNQDSTNDYMSYVSSGDGSFLNVSLFPSYSVNYARFIRFHIERSRDVNGNPTNLGTFMQRYDTSSNLKSEAVDYPTMFANIVNRGCFVTGHELSSAKVLNNGTDTPLFKPEVITNSRIKWQPSCLLGYSSADAGMLQTITVNGIDYLTLGTASSSSDIALQPYAYSAMAYY